MSKNEEVNAHHCSDVQSTNLLLQVMLRFSLKEAVYKSIAPELGRLVSYKEIEVQPREDGTATVTNKLAEGKRSKMFSSEAQWRELSPTDTGRRRRYWVSCVHSFDFSE